MDGLNNDIKQYLIKGMIHNYMSCARNFTQVNRYWYLLIDPLLRAYIRSNFIHITHMNKTMKDSIRHRILPQDMVNILLNEQYSEDIILKHRFLPIVIKKLKKHWYSDVHLNIKLYSNNIKLGKHRCYDIFSWYFARAVRGHVRLVIIFLIKYLPELYISIQFTPLHTKNITMFFIKIDSAATIYIDKSWIY